jgi:diguanylate cyclase (GGDEF)-like protein
MGHARAVLLVTAVSVAMSVSLTWPLMTIASPDGEDLGIALLIAVVVPLIVAPIASHLFIRLVFELERAHADLSQVAIRDSLTQLYNRRHFMDQLQVEAGRHFRTGEPMTLLMIDADRFKSINDAFGHGTGDRALQAIARACQASLRDYDVLARYGGEEFAALLPGTSRQEACDVAERIRTTVAGVQIETPNGGWVTVTVSIGISTLSSPDPECKQLFDSADSALYAAKNSGRNRWVVAERAAA